MPRSVGFADAVVGHDDAAVAALRGGGGTDHGDGDRCDHVGVGEDVNAGGAVRGEGAVERGDDLSGIFDELAVAAESFGGAVVAHDPEL